MTVDSLPRRFFLLAIFAMASLGFLASACTGVVSPEGWASPVLDDDLLLVAHRDELFALEPDTMVERWAFPTDRDDDDVDAVAIYGDPAILDDTVFVPGYDGTLYALERETGNISSIFEDADGALIGGVAVGQDTIYFGSSDGKVYALDVDGAEAWRQPFETGDGVWSTPTLAGDTLYVTSLDGHLYALDAETGSERWSFEADAGIVSPPVVNEEAGLIYVGGLDSLLRAIDVETHEERWALQADNWFWTRPLVEDGVLYAGSLDGNVYAVDALTGEPRWTQPFETEAPVRAAPVIAAGVLFVADRDGNIYGIELEDGLEAFASPLVLEDEVLADLLLRSASPADDDVSPQEVLVVTTDGELTRIDPETLRAIERVDLTRN